MKATFLFFVTLIFLSSSCKTIGISDLQPTASFIQPSLPPLDAFIDARSIEYAYNLDVTTSQSDSDGGLVRVTDGVWIGSGTTNSRSVSNIDKRIHDITTIWDKEVLQRISVPDGDPVGSIVLSIPVSESRASGWGWFTASVLTLGIPNLFGMPFHSYRHEIELEAVIKDCNGSILGRYLGYGKQSTNVALYHGYAGGSNLMEVSGREGAARKSNIIAVQQAIDSIKGQINRDASRLADQLLGCK